MSKDLASAVNEDDREWFMQAILDACRTFKEEVSYLSDDTERLHSYCLDAMPFIEMINRLGNLGFDIKWAINSEKDNIENILKLVDELEDVATKAIEQHGSKQAREKLARDRNTVVYEFSDDDFSRMQVLVNELREMVVKSPTLDDEHRLRLLKRLEKLQLELHKTTSDLDRFWGLLGDAGAAIGKFGEDTKPFIDRIRELVDILRRTQSKGPVEIEGNSGNNLPSPEDNDL